MGSVVLHRLSCPKAMESSQTRDWNIVPCIGRWILIHWSTREVLFFKFFRIELQLTYNTVLVLSDSVKMSFIQGPIQKQSWPQMNEFFPHWRAFNGGATCNRWTTRLRKQTRENEYPETGNTGSYYILGTENSRRGHNVSVRTRTLGRSPPSEDVVEEGGSCFQK